MVIGEKGNTKMIICESNSQSIKTTQTPKLSVYNKKKKKRENVFENAVFTSTTLQASKQMCTVFLSPHCSACNAVYEIYTIQNV